MVLLVNQDRGRYQPSADEEENDNSQLLGLLHLQSTPRKDEVVAWGYDLDTPSGRRDCCATVLLWLLLVVCAVTVNGLTSSVRLIYVKADRCETRESALLANAALMRNITNYHSAREASAATVNLTATAYYLAQEAYEYNRLGTRFTWPSPFNLAEEERQALAIQAREGGDGCAPVKDCLGGFIGWMGGVVDQDACVTASVPCPDIESTALLVEYDSSQGPLDLFGENVTRGREDEERFNAVAVAQTVLDQATDAISELVRTVNFTSSIYVLYLAFLVVVTPPFIVYGAKWNEREFDFLANVNKPLWIFFIVLVWFAHELFQSIVNSSPYNVIWANFLKDPCWADPEFLVNTSAAISETCTDVASAHNLFSQAGANYRYYKEVENTWQAAAATVGSAGPFYGNPDEDLLPSFPGNCSATMLLDAIQPGDGTVNWWSLFYHSGAFVALLLQLVLAHWFISWFSVLRPLTMNRGRVMIPETSQNDPVLYREVRSFARRRAILPFVFTTVSLVFLMVNLGVSSSGEDVGRYVLVGSSVLVFLQFGVVPFLIWREEDEAMTAVRPTAKRHEKERQQQQPQPPRRQQQQQQQQQQQHQKQKKRPPPPPQPPQPQQQHERQRQRQQPQQEEQQQQRRRRRRQRQQQQQKNQLEEGEKEEEEKVVVVVEELESSMPIYSPLRPGEELENSLGSVIKAALEATTAAAAVGDVRTPR